MSGSPKLLALGDAAWTVEFGDAIAPDVHARVMALAAAVETLGEPAVLDLVPTFRSLTVHFDPLAIDGAGLGRRLLAAAAGAAGSEVAGRRWRLPACFGGGFGPDLPAVAEEAGITEGAAVELLAGAELRVFMIGFMPGFPYMGGLPDILHRPRLATPRLKVPARSVAIAGAMAAVYPWESPGGWRLLGRTPLRLFDAGNAARPALLAPGDTVRLLPVGEDEYGRLEAEAAAGRLDPEVWLG
ncbi:MAG: 5-oxoprolinase subunit PxpB [Rhodocyclaceae bacterium]|nr:5-oxoprolinase subunit PxpB [Rhodocyclaceae bacterium]